MVAPVIRILLLSGVCENRMQFLSAWGQLSAHRQEPASERNNLQETVLLGGFGVHASFMGPCITPVERTPARKAEGPCIALSARNTVIDSASVFSLVE
jgi:hypothetical protein